MLGLLKTRAWPISVGLAGAAGLAVAVVTSLPPPAFRPVAAREDALPQLGSEARFRAYLAQRAEILKARAPDNAVALEMVVEPAADAAAPAAMRVDAADGAEGITNVQEVGVDEGGIVKAAGDHLVILRRGRLFTVSIAQGGLRAVDAIAVTPPGAAPGSAFSTWYDEMLVVGDRVVVIGYSYERRGTEILRFRMSRDGRLRFEDASRLSAADYYSAENYATRLIGDELVMYNLRPLDGDFPDEVLPILWDETPGRPRTAQVLTRPEDVYIDPKARPTNPAFGALHSISRCDLTAARLDCEATAVIGPWSRTFYVSPRAVYLWTSGEDDGDGRAPATVYRMPLNGGAPQAVRVAGSPLDQFSLREDARRGRLDVLVLSGGGGDGMWSRENRRGSAALLSLPLSRFGGGEDRARASDYRDLPDLPRDGWNRHNRFVGDHLLYAVDRPAPDGWGESIGGVLVAVPVEGGRERVFDLPAPVSRIEGLGRDALIVGGDRTGMVLTALELDGAPRLGARYAFAEAGEAEERSHGFFYRQDVAGGDRGLLGLPILRSGSSHGRDPGMDMLFVRRSPDMLSEIGRLTARSGERQDRCRVSCADWYGQARPIFLNGRVFALMGYELVEGRVDGDRIREIGRLDFTPGG